jgi:hypothetical protein
MVRKYLSLALSLLLLNAVGARAAFAGQGSQEAHTAKMKAWVARRGVGKSARGAVRMFDRTKVEGYVKVAREDDFIVLQDRDGAEVSVPYSQVKNLTNDTRSAGKKTRNFALGFGALVGIICLIGWGASHS